MGRKRLLSVLVLGLKIVIFEEGGGICGSGLFGLCQITRMLVICGMLA